VLIVGDPFKLCIKVSAVNSSPRCLCVRVYSHVPYMCVCVYIYIYKVCVCVSPIGYRLTMVRASGADVIGKYIGRRAETSSSVCNSFFVGV